MLLSLNLILLAALGALAQVSYTDLFDRLQYSAANASTTTTLVLAYNGQGEPPIGPQRLPFWQESLEDATTSAMKIRNIDDEIILFYYDGLYAQTVLTLQALVLKHPVFVKHELEQIVQQEINQLSNLTASLSQALVSHSRGSLSKRFATVGKALVAAFKSALQNDRPALVPLP